MGGCKEMLLQGKRKEIFLFLRFQTFFFWVKKKKNRNFAQVEALSIHLCFSSLFCSELRKCGCKLVGLQIYLLNLSIPLSKMSICNFEVVFSPLRVKRVGNLFQILAQLLLMKLAVEIECRITFEHNFSKRKHVHKSAVKKQWGKEE